MKIQQKLTNNYSRVLNRKIEYIVIHYVGAVSSAKNNADYYANNKLEASAHYFVDEKEIWQSVCDKDVAWHCGGGLQGKNGHTLHGICKNSNSIGIEMCVKKDKAGSWYFEPETVKNTVELVKMLMAKYNIPIERVCRHYDVTGKTCPAPFINETEWRNFKAKIIMEEGLTMSQYEELKTIIENITPKIYHYTKDLPDYARPIIQELLDRKIFNGKADDDLELSEDMMRMLVINYNAGLYKE